MKASIPKGLLAFCFWSQNVCSLYMLFLLVLCNIPRLNIHRLNRLQTVPFVNMFLIFKVQVILRKFIIKASPVMRKITDHLCVTFALSTEP